MEANETTAAGRQKADCRYISHPSADPGRCTQGKTLFLCIDHDNTQKDREDVLYTVLASIFHSSRGDCLGVWYLLAEALKIYVLGFPPPEVGQNSACMGSFVRYRNFTGTEMKLCGL